MGRLDEIMRVTNCNDETAEDLVGYFIEHKAEKMVDVIAGASREFDMSPITVINAIKLCNMH